MIESTLSMNNDYAGGTVTRSAEFPKPAARKSSSIRKIAIGGGKGGVGKTCLALLLAIYLAKQNRKVVLIDADFSGPDLHRLIGISKIKFSLHNFLTNGISHINQLLIRTPIDSLSCICCENSITGSEVNLLKRRQFFSQVNELEADFVIFDLSSRMLEISAELFLDADHHLVVSNNEVASIQQSFYFLKFCSIQYLKQVYSEALPWQKDKIRWDTYARGNFQKFRSNLLKMLHVREPKLIEDYWEDFVKFRPHFIFNMIHNDDVKKQQMAFRIAVKEALDIDLSFLGSLNFTHKLRKAMRSKIPLDNLDALIKNWANLEHIFIKFLFHQFDNYLPQLVRRTRHNLPYVLSPGNQKEQEKDIICSNQCSYWEKCRMQRGGYPCRVKYIGFLCEHLN